MAEVSWSDYDGDGFDDLLIVDPNRSLRLWRSLAERGFQNVTESSGLTVDGPATRVAWMERARARGADLYVETSNVARLFRIGESGRFTPLELELPSAFATGAPTGDPTGDPTVDPSANDTASPTVPTSPTLPGGGGSLPGPSGSPTPTLGTPTPGGPSEAAGMCSQAIADQATAACLMASSVPTLGALYPLSAQFFVDAATGFVGMGTTTPVYRLHVEGQSISGTNNVASDPDAAIGGGLNNQASGAHSTIGGGDGNSATGLGATIAGGTLNLALSDRSVVVGGVGNRAAYRGFVGGGNNNAATGNLAVISGGNLNDALQTGDTVGGGNTNTANAGHGTVAGGHSNTVTGAYGAVPGGRNNAASGANSLAAGRRAKASHDGAFVWGDSADADISSTAPDQFVVRASGGMGIGAAPAPGFQLDVAGPTNVAGIVDVDGVRFDDGTLQTTAGGFGGGMPGPTGPTGPTGPAGPAGAQGPAGPTGPAGAAGVAGATGPAGGDGAAGSQGPTGPTGPAGTPGGPPGPTGPQGAVGPPGAAGPAGPPGSIEPAEPTGVIGTLTFTADGSSVGPVDIYAFRQENRAVDLFGGADAPVFTVTVDTGVVTVPAQVLFADQGSGSDTFTIVLDALSHPAFPGATVTVSGTASILDTYDQREFGIGFVGPREDLGLAAGDVDWTFDDGGSVQETASFDGSGWGYEQPSSPPTFRVWDGMILSAAASPDSCYGADFSIDQVAGPPSRQIELVKPLSPLTVSILHFGFNPQVPFNAFSNDLLPVGLDYMGGIGQGQTGVLANYRFDDAYVSDWRIESVGGRVQEVLTIVNRPVFGGPAPGSGEVTMDGGNSFDW